MIKPTVGRVVWYYRYDGSGHEGPMAAHVAYVHSDSMVNLMVIDENGDPHSKTSVELIQDDEFKPINSYCCWMPYQIGQASKTERLENELAGRPPIDAPQAEFGGRAPAESEASGGTNSGS